MTAKFLRCVLDALLVCAIAVIADNREKTLEGKAMTGSTRTKTRYGYVFTTPWKVRRSWVEESAARQGIPTDDGWQFLTGTSENWFFGHHGCGRAPAACLLGKITPRAWGLKTKTEADRFAREFMAADEKRRKEMLAHPY